MALSAAPFLSQTDYYHPPKHTNTPFDVLIWAVVLVAILVITITAAHVARSRETRKLAEAREGAGS